jgi:hypothetical protein
MSTEFSRFFLPSRLYFPRLNLIWGIFYKGKTTCGWGPLVIACVGPRHVLIGRAGWRRPVVICPHKNPRHRPRLVQTAVSEVAVASIQAALFEAPRHRHFCVTGPPSRSPRRRLVRAALHRRLLRAAGRLAPHATVSPI